MRKRGEKTIDTNLLSSLACPPGWLLCFWRAFAAAKRKDIDKIRARAMVIVTISWFCKKAARDPCLWNKAQTYIYSDPGLHGAGDAACDAPPQMALWPFPLLLRRMWAEIFASDFSPLLDCEIRFSFFLKNTRRRPDTNGRGNVLFYLRRSTFTPKMGQIKIQV